MKSDFLPLAVPSILPLPPPPLALPYYARNDAMLLASTVMVETTERLVWRALATAAARALMDPLADLSTSTAGLRGIAAAERTRRSREALAQLTGTPRGRVGTTLAGIRTWCTRNSSAMMANRQRRQAGLAQPKGGGSVASKLSRVLAQRNDSCTKTILAPCR